MTPTITIDRKKDEPLLDKIRIEATAQREKNQTKAEIIKEIAKQLSISEELITIEHVYPLFGQGSVRILASGYKRPETKNFFKRKEKKSPATPSGG